MKSVGSHIFMDLRQILMKLLNCTKFGIVNFIFVGGFLILRKIVDFAWHSFLLGLPLLSSPAISSPLRKA